MLTTAQPVTYPKATIVNYYETKQSPFFIQFDGTTLTETTKDTIKTVKPRGLILQNMNITDEKQLKDLTDSIHEYGKSLGIKIEIATDEEGGVVSRLKNMPEYPKYNGMSSFQQNIPQAEIYLEEQNHAAFLHEMGIDINFAPVTDIAYTTDSIMQSRSPSNDPKAASEIIGVVIGSHHNIGVKTTAKHFPGHGRTTIDSHQAVPIIDISKTDWFNSDAQPFIKAIESNTEYIMTGHLIYPQIDKNPASISSTWIKEVLRKELGFKGKVITDDLKMNGLTIPKEITDQLNKESDPISDLAIKSKLAISAGNNYIIMILPDEKMIRVYNKWLSLEKAEANI